MQDHLIRIALSVLNLENVREYMPGGHTIYPVMGIDGLLSQVSARFWVRLVEVSQKIQKILQEVFGDGGVHPFYSG
jgi:hypothetical protein